MILENMKKLLNIIKKELNWEVGNKKFGIATIE